MFFFFVFFYALFPGDYSQEAFYSSDEIFYFRLTESLVEQRTLEISPYLGHTHSKYTPGQSLAGIPAYLAGRILTKTFPRLFPAYFTLISSIHLTNIIIGALICLVFYALLRDLEYGRGPSLLATFILGLATTFFPYSKQYFADPLAALFLLLCARDLNHSRRSPGHSETLAGLFFSLAVFTKVDMFVLLFPLFLALATWREERGMRMFRFILGMIPVGVLHAVYNHFNFGGVFHPGYGRQDFASPFFSGLYGLLLSPGRGLLIYSPPVFIALAGIAAFRRRHAAFWFLIAGLSLTRIIVLSKWFSWQGGWCWGPRLLLPILPLVMLPIVEVFEGWHRIRREFRWGMIGLIAAGIIVQLAGTLVSPNKYPNDIWGMMRGQINEFLFIPQISPIKGNLFLLMRGKMDMGWLTLMSQGGVGTGMLFAAFLAPAVFLGGALLREAGLGEENWFRRFIPDPQKLIIPLIIILAVALYSVTVLFGQGLDTMRHTYIEFRREAGSMPLPRTFSGYIMTPIEGEYQFDLKVRGTYTINIDGATLLYNMEDLPQRWDQARVTLTKGMHSLRGTYTPRQDSDIALMHLYWTIPDGGEYKNIIGPMYLYREPPGGFRRLLMLGVRLRVWILAGLLALYFIRREDRRRPAEP